MENLNEIVNDIKNKYGSEITEEDLEEYFSTYISYYREDVQTPKLGFTSVVGWFGDRRKEFLEAVAKANVSILESVSEPVHDYNLVKTGLSRVEELYRKIKA